MTAVRVEGCIDGDPKGAWILNEAEHLLKTLTGVVSARMVTSAGGEIEEIHLLTTDDVTPKQVVRNVESALLAQLGIDVDHRKISVAQSSGSDDSDADAFVASNGRPTQPSRVLFLGHEIENQRPHQVRARVKIQWNGERFDGEAEGTDLPRTRLEILANAVLKGLEAIIRPALEEADVGVPVIALDGVKTIDSFDREYVLVSVQAIHGRDVKILSGSAPVENMAERAVILATLQATDRWVRGLL